MMKNAGHCKYLYAIREVDSHRNCEPSIGYFTTATQALQYIKSNYLNYGSTSLHPDSHKIVYISRESVGLANGYKIFS